VGVVEFGAGFWLRTGYILNRLDLCCENRHTMLLSTYHLPLLLVISAITGKI